MTCKIKCIAFAGFVALAALDTWAAANSESLEKQKPVILDVRTPAEYEAGHVSGSTNVPISELERRIPQVVKDKDAPIVVHCQSGGRSARAKAELEKLGYRNVRDLGSLRNARAVLEGKKTEEGRR